MIRIPASMATLRRPLHAGAAAVRARTRLLLAVALCVAGAGVAVAAEGGIDTVAACQAKPGRAGHSYMREEFPVPWNYRPVEPSTRGCKGDGHLYEVGPGQKYLQLRDVPWSDLEGCDEVRIHWRPEPYTDAIFLGSRGEADRYITVRGVPGPAGQLPVIDGNGATMPRDESMHPGLDLTGMVIIAKPYMPNEARHYKPGYLLITGLHVRNARPPSKVTSVKGRTVPWPDFSSGIYVNGGEHIAIVGNELSDNGLGLFVNSLYDEDNQSRDLLIRGNWFHDNGVLKGASQHNSYTEAIGTTYEGNYFGPPLAGSGADNIKDRSAGIVFRYNHIEDGVNLISLRDPDSNRVFESAAMDCLGERLVASAFVYGNTLVATRLNIWDEMPIVLAHGDGPNGVSVRDGSLYFYGNTVISRVDERREAGTGVPLFNPINGRSPVTVIARNNLFYATSHTPGSQPAPFALFFWAGHADFESNWINRFHNVMATQPDDNLASGQLFDGSGLGGLAPSQDDPGFVDFARGDYRYQPGSPFLSLQAPLPQAVLQRDLVPAGQPVAKPFGPYGAAAPWPAARR